MFAVVFCTRTYMFFESSPRQHPTAPSNSSAFDELALSGNADGAVEEASPGKVAFFLVGLVVFCISWCWDQHDEAKRRRHSLSRHVPDLNHVPAVRQGQAAAWQDSTFEQALLPLTRSSDRLSSVEFAFWGLVRYVLKMLWITLLSAWFAYFWMK
jgi:hypothetical protein